MIQQKQQAVKKTVERHFSYKSIYTGCIETNGITIYNEVMEDYLDKINGDKWRIKEQQMIDSLIK